MEENFLERDANAEEPEDSLSARSGRTRLSSKLELPHIAFSNTPSSNIPLPSIALPTMTAHYAFVLKSFA